MQLISFSIEVECNFLVIKVTSKALLYIYTSDLNMGGGFGWGGKTGSHLKICLDFVSCIDRWIVWTSASTISNILFPRFIRIRGKLSITVRSVGPVDDGMVTEEHQLYDGRFLIITTKKKEITPFILMKETIKITWERYDPIWHLSFLLSLFITNFLKILITVI